MTDRIKPTNGGKILCKDTFIKTYFAELLNSSSTSESSIVLLIAAGIDQLKVIFEAIPELDGRFIA